MQIFRRMHPHLVRGLGLTLMVSSVIGVVPRQAVAQTAGSTCTIAGDVSPDGGLVCAKTKQGKRSVLRWKSAAAPATLGKARSDAACLTGRWVEDRYSLEGFVRQMTGNRDATVTGVLQYEFANGMLTGTGSAVVGQTSTSTTQITGAVSAPSKTFPYSYDGIALSMQLAADGDYPRFFDVSMVSNGTAVAVKTGNPGGPAFFPLVCKGDLAQLSLQTPSGVATRTLRRSVR
jgi:hypothetical protein